MCEASVSRDLLPVKRDVIPFGREVLPFKYRSSLSEYNRLRWYQYVTYGNMWSWYDRDGFVWIYTGEHALPTPTPEERASTYIIPPKMLYSAYIDTTFPRMKETLAAAQPNRTVIIDSLHD